MLNFADYNLDPKILTALEILGFKEPLPIQAEAIPLIQKKRDLIALAETGSGKTAACAIPICDRVDTSRPVIQALIVVPTRELALQYAIETQKIGDVKGVKTFAVYGGENLGLQQSKLKHGVHVCVATPGRLIDFIYSSSIDLTNVETIILDEADEMLGMGFYDNLEFIMSCLVHEHQTLLFSATMPKEIREIAMRHMKDPLEVTLNAGQKTPALIEHFFSYSEHPRKRLEDLERLLHKLKPKQGLIFCRSRDEVEEVCRDLQRSFRDVEYLHAGLAQEKRSSITGRFRSGKTHLLVATDVAARGLDFSGVTHVFHYHLPRDPEAYVHRSGRTGRSGRAGVSVALVTDRDMPAVQPILKHIGRELQWIEPPSAHPAPRSYHHRHPGSRGH